MILLVLITTVVFGPAAYVLTAGKTRGHRLLWAAIVVVIACAFEIGFLVYIGDKLPAD